MIKIEKQFRFWAGIALVSLSTLGCASPYLVARRSKTLDLQPNQGVLLLSCKFSNKEKPQQKNVFTLMNLALQEANQYKIYQQKSMFLIPPGGESYVSVDDIFLFSLKLPVGTYRMTSLEGIFRSFFGMQYSANVYKIFDIDPGKINYGGRLVVNFLILGGKQTHEVIVEDQFVEDEKRFKNQYPVLQNRSIAKGLLY